MVKKKEILNEKEKNEIMNDVKQALNKAQSKVQKPQSKFVISITIAIILLIFTCGIVWYISNNPKVIFERSIDSVFSHINQNIKDLDNAKEEINLIYSQNSSNNEKQSCNLKNNTKNEKTYTIINEISKNYIELNNINLNSNLKNQIEFLNKSINKAVEGYKIKSSKETINIDEKTIKTHKTSLELTSSEIDNLLKKIETNLKKENNVISTNKYINDLKNQYKNLDFLTINIYTKGVNYEFVKLEILKQKNNLIDSISITNIDKNKYKYLLDLKTTNEKKSGMISHQEKNIYNISENADKNSKTYQTNLNIVISENTNNNKKIKESIKYSDLKPEEKIIIDNKINSLKDFAPIFFN